MGCHFLLQESFPAQGLNPCLLSLLHYREGSLPLALDSITSLVAQMVKNLPAMRETWVRSLDWEDSLEEGMETHSSILAWRIPMDRGAWRATVHRVTKSWTRLKRLSSSSSSHTKVLKYFTNLVTKQHSFMTLLIK